MEKKLVSVLTPCYNTGRYIHRLLDSVLSQSYPCIEMVVVDDGSTDDSASIIKSYIPRFAKKGYELKYVYQENSGQSVAIQNGLHIARGEYLVWPDSDDYYASDKAIEILVDRLEHSSPEIAMVRAMLRVVGEETLYEIRIQGEDAPEEDDTLFCKCLLGDFYFTPGVYMVRMSVLRETTGLDIYTSKYAGQNWQLYLPVLYSYRCLTIKEVLYNVLERADSHSRGGFKGYEQQILRLDVYETTLLETLKRIKGMPDYERNEYNSKIEYKYLRLKFRLALKYQKCSEIIKFYKEIKGRYPEYSNWHDSVYYWTAKTKTLAILHWLLSMRNKFVE